jgi:hypothetical protein
MIAKMTGGLPVLELFARHDPANPLPQNWQAWGNQSNPSRSDAATGEDFNVVDAETLPA